MNGVCPTGLTNTRRYNTVDDIVLDRFNHPNAATYSVFYLLRQHGGLNVVDWSGSGSGKVGAYTHV